MHGEIYHSIPASEVGRLLVADMLAAGVAPEQSIAAFV